MAESRPDIENSVGVPIDLIGDWNFWSVRNEIAVDVSVDDSEFDEIKGLYLGFGSGDRDKWATLLRSSPTIQYLVSWTGYNTQRFFDSICGMHWLKRLCFGRLGAQDISEIEALSELEFFCATQLSGPKTIESLATLQKLRVVEIGLPKRSSHLLECFQSNEMLSLQSMRIYSSSYLTVPSISPLSKLRSLQYLSMPTIQSKDRSLKSLLELPDLRFVHLPKKGWAERQILDLVDAGIEVRLG